MTATDVAAAPVPVVQAAAIRWFTACVGQDGAPQCLAVMYHYVGDRDESLSRGVKGLPTAAFDAQLDLLCRTAEPVDWPALSAWLAGQRDLPERAFLLTFDDGLADHAQVVAPALARRGLTGLFFIPGAVVTSPAMLPAHQIHLLLARLTLLEFQTALLRALRELDELGGSGAEQACARQPAGGPELPCGRGSIDWLARVDAAAADAMYHYESPPRARLKFLLTETLPVALRNRVLDRLFEQHVGSGADWHRLWYLSADDVKMLHAGGHVIGGHGFSHEPGRRLSLSRRDEDMRRSARVLGDLLGTAVEVMSFPYGSVDPAVIESARNAGFRAAFSTRPAVIRRGVQPLALPRVDTIAVESGPPA